MIEFIALVLEYCRLRENGEAMSKALGDEELSVVVFSQFHGYVFTVSRATFTDIYCHVQYSTLYATYKFALSIRWTLEMESSHHTVSTHTFVVLHKLDCMTKYRCHFLIELTLRETLKEVPSPISKYFGF